MSCEKMCRQKTVHVNGCRENCQEREMYRCIGERTVLLSDVGSAAGRRSPGIYAAGQGSRRVRGGEARDDENRGERGRPAAESRAHETSVGVVSGRGGTKRVSGTPEDARRAGARRVRASHGERGPDEVQEGAENRDVGGKDGHGGHGRGGACVSFCAGLGTAGISKDLTKRSSAKDPRFVRCESSRRVQRGYTSH